MNCYLGIDTSNYTTSTALYNCTTGEILQQKRLLPVKEGTLGLKQSDAIFHHTRQLPRLMEELCKGNTCTVQGVGVSVRPRDMEGSYMPCFLAGESVAASLAAVLGVPKYEFAHQQGHIVAALYSTDRMDLLDQEFIAFHVSGGTTECVLCNGAEGRLQTTLFSATSDLNAGQAIDRVGVAMGLAFPAGPALEQLALQSNQQYKARVSFKGDNPSISGLENQCKKMLAQGEAPVDVARYAIDFIMAVVDGMTRRVQKVYGHLPLIYAGGVMSNSIIREEITQRFGGSFAQPVFSSDNATGIALLAAQKDGALWHD